jgi:hypothetical protein
MTDGLNPTEMAAARDLTAAYTPGASPESDAWYTEFFIENHLDHFSYPDQVASPEQVRFMVYTQGEQRYYPCSDRMFEAIMKKMASAFLQEKYREVLTRILATIERQIENDTEKAYLKSLIQIKFTHETRDELMVPSRLEKRLLQIFFNRTQIEDPCLEEKAKRNRQASEVLCSPALRKALDQLETTGLKSLPDTLSGIKDRVEHIELKRLFALCTSGLWKYPDQLPSFEALASILDAPMTGNGVQPLFAFLGPGTGPGYTTRKILWLADETGEVIFDLAAIRYLSQLGHKIIVAFKDGPLYTKADFPDARSDEALSRELEGAMLIREKAMNKNDLVRTLRSDQNIFAISDGTRENLNLLMVSTTFARIFKEVDGIISRGEDQRRRFFDTQFQFTQDIFNIARDADGSPHISFKPKHPAVIKFSHSDLEKRARSIIAKMEGAKKQGMTVVFYSGIIGSIPGKVHMAKKIMSTFVAELKHRYAMTFIINPSEHFEAGMDADDLMYMWEIVQRSGFIDIWRFQSYEDIVQAFEIMDTRVPPEWVGKDATYSTGCTKEMRIAVDVQKHHPEMQIIGPSQEKFMRRNAYGVGKLYDQRLV